MIIKLATKHEEVASHTPVAAVLEPAIYGGTIGGLVGAGISLATHHPAAMAAAVAAPVLGGALGLGYGLKRKHDLEQAGEFRKPIKANYRGTKTGPGLLASSLGNISGIPLGTIAYDSIKSFRRAHDASGS